MTRSPSSRRAWVEMDCIKAIKSQQSVALLAEGVGRNPLHLLEHCTDKQSPSSRRAWVEIKIVDTLLITPSSPSSRRAWVEIRVCRSPRSSSLVALLAEGVGRNFWSG